MKKIIIIILLFFCLDVYSSNNNGILKVSNSFVSTGGKYQKINIEGKGKILSEEKSSDIAVRIYKSSGRKAVYRISKEKAAINLIGGDVIISITEAPEENLHYVSFLVSQHSAGSNINNIRRYILKGFSIYNVKPSFSYLIIGKYPYKMTIEDMSYKANIILKRSGAQFINSIKDRKLISVIGFLPEFDGKVKIVNNITNLNIALRYDEIEKSTYIWIGCPIISVEY